MLSSNQLRSATKSVKSNAKSVDDSKSNDPDIPLLVAFWKPQEANGFYSQWFASKMVFNQKIYDELPTDIKGLKIFETYPKVIDAFMETGTYNCAEQFMMLGKALIFEDKTVAVQIMRTTDPSTQKNLGRKVKNFNTEIWMEVAMDVVTLGSYLKFSQNLKLRQLMLESGNAVLIEASPFDNTWGIGLNPDNPKIVNRKNWKGKNLLGECLMRTRVILSK